MHLLHDIHHGDPEQPNCVVEISQGSFNKHEVHKDYGILVLDRVNYGPSAYPFNYGFIPQTHWDDDDALDVIIVSSFPLHPGTLMALRPIGLMKMTDDGECDDNLIAVPLDDKRWEHITDVSELSPHVLREWRRFLETYKDLKGKDTNVQIGEILGRDAGIQAVQKGIAMYRDKYKRVGETEVWEGK